MRKSIIGICLALPVAALAFACSSTDDTTNTANGGSPSGGSANGGAGGHAGSANGGTGGRIGAAGSDSGGESGSGVGGGKTVESAGAGGASEAGAAGALAEGGEAGSTASGGSTSTTASAVYTLSNGVINSVFGFTRSVDGSLTPMAAPFLTNGVGSAVALGGQGALAYDQQNARIYAVNSGDNSFSVFPVKLDGSLGTAIKVDTSAVTPGPLLGPKSVTFHGSNVYVLFEGDMTHPSRIAGWTVTSNAAGVPSASAIGGSSLPLSQMATGVDPAEIKFSPDGAWLIVTEKQTGAGGTFTGKGNIDSFSVGASGLAVTGNYYGMPPLPHDTTLQSTPYGFAFQGTSLIVSEAASNGVASYSYNAGVVAPVVAPNTQFELTGPAATPVAPCWVAISGQNAYVANATAANISGFSVSASGSLSALSPAIEGSIVASTGAIATGPTEESVSADGKFLYVLNSNVPSLGIFAINAAGALTPALAAGDYKPALTALPAGSVGLVAR